MCFYLKLKPQDGFDYEKFVSDCSHNKIPALINCDVDSLEDPISEFRSEIIEFINNYGFDKVIQRNLVLGEAVIAIGAPKNDIINKFTSYFDFIGKNKNYCIIDPYIFPSKFDQTYMQLLQSILSIAGNIGELHIITSTKYNQSVKQQFVSMVSTNFPNTHLKINHSDDYHDRFWLNIVDENGFVVGTSLNGLGKKYTSLSYLEKADTIVVISALRAASLL
jgi:hypothetical protein